MEKSFQNKRESTFMFTKSCHEGLIFHRGNFILYRVIFKVISPHYISTSGSLTPENICSTPLAWR
jgi:hypothetical protein